MRYDEAKSILSDMMRKINYYENVIMTLSWDMRVNLPTKAVPYRGETIGFLTDCENKLKQNPVLDEAAMTILGLSDEADPITLGMAGLAQREYTRAATLPDGFMSAYASFNLEAEAIWQEAKKSNDYEMFRPYLMQEFDFKRRYAEALGHGSDPLSFLMSEWEEGMNVARMDALFGELKDFLLPFLKAIAEKDPPGDTGFRMGHYPLEAQRQLVRETISKVGYDFGAGRLDESAHPYTTANNINDIRITTRYFENDFTMALISSLHETGHALYRQRMDPRLSGTRLDSSPSMAVDESQSRYLENFIGRSMAFWEWMLPQAVAVFSDLTGYDVDSFYRAFNTVHPGVSRLEADELTYNLHIIIRYEIEKLLFAGDIGYDELPQVWDSKYEEYLGVRPQNYSEGALQDMHWASGYIGYFPCYVLGNFYAGHFYEAMKKDLPDMYGLVARGCFEPLILWQKEHVYDYGRIHPPAGLLMRLGYGELSARYYIDYIREKYTRIYGL